MPEVVNIMQVLGGDLASRNWRSYAAIFQAWPLSTGSLLLHSVFGKGKGTCAIERMEGQKLDVILFRRCFALVLQELLGLEILGLLRPDALARHFPQT